MLGQLRVQQAALAMIHILHAAENVADLQDLLRTETPERRQRLQQAVATLYEVVRDLKLA